MKSTFFSEYLSIILPMVGPTIITAKAFINSKIAVNLTEIWYAFTRTKIAKVIKICFLHPSKKVSK
ncbi:MAG: hypothetical protein GYA61_06280 [Spirochaetales bacterium]|nr:hypothetical protein [Exilispira sp.]NMC67817.1 hypothetical protein [Spirochaetales bacterium]